MSAKKTKIMYIEDKASGDARIGRVTYSKSDRSVYYRDREFVPFQGFKSNFLDTEARTEFWISGPKRRGGDRLFGSAAVAIDGDVRVEYWTSIREEPERLSEASYRD